jgi:transcriptional regulator with XRE-family HTH domain
MATGVNPEIGERVMVCRHCVRLSQQELAKQAQMSPTSLNRLELGHHSVSAERLAVLATLLNVRADYLCGFIPFPLPLWDRADRAAAVAAQQAP